MAKLTHLKSITSTNVLNSYQLLLNSFFGGKLPEPYNPQTQYNKGDAIIVQNPDGSYVLKIVKAENGTTGDYKDKDWITVYFTDLFKEGSALDIDFTKATQISETQPTDKDNVTWFQPIDLKDGDGGDINIEGNARHGILIFKNEHFAAQEEKPEGPEVRLWLDYE